jgi:hypothetical protein
MQQENSLLDDILIEQQSARKEKTTVVINDGYKVQTLMFNNDASKNISSKSAPHRLPQLISKGKGFDEVGKKIVKKVHFEDQPPKIEELKKRRNSFARIDTPYKVFSQDSSSEKNELSEQSEPNQNKKEMRINGEELTEADNQSVEQFLLSRKNMTNDKNSQVKDNGSKSRLVGPHIEETRPMPPSQSPSLPASFENNFGVTDSKARQPLMVKFKGEKDNNHSLVPSDPSENLEISPEMSLPISAKLPVTIYPHESIFGHYRNHYPYHRSNEIHDGRCSQHAMPLKIWDDPKNRKKNGSFAIPTLTITPPPREKEGDFVLHTFSKHQGPTEICSKIRH